MCIISVPLWITEIVPPKDRGVLASGTTIMATFGFVLASYVGVGFFYLRSSTAWRGPLAIGCLFPLSKALKFPWLCTG